MRSFLHSPVNEPVGTSKNRRQRSEGETMGVQRLLPIDERAKSTSVAQRSQPAARQAFRRAPVILALGLLFGGPLVQAQTQTGRPAGLQPLPEVPPPPAGVDLEAALEPEVTIVKRGQDKVEEFRINGKLYMLRITPPHGKPYYLIDEQGSGHWVRRDGPESGLRVPMWVIHSF